jgi:hypothetical protein
MEIFLFPIIFSIRAAISILLFFEYYLSSRSGSLLIWFKISISGHVSSHGSQFPVILEDSGGLFFELSLSFRSRCTHSFGLYMILDLNIASSLFSIYFGILSLA